MVWEEIRKKAFEDLCNNFSSTTQKKENRQEISERKISWVQ